MPTGDALVGAYAMLKSQFETQQDTLEKPPRSAIKLFEGDFWLPLLNVSDIEGFALNLSGRAQTDLLLRGWYRSE